MSKYEDFKGDIIVDFEGNTTLAEKIKEYFNIELHPDDRIIAINFSTGEYHHHIRNNVLKTLTFSIINKIDIDKPVDKRKTKEIKICCESYDQFFSLFKRTEINLRPFNQRFTS